MTLHPPLSKKDHDKKRMDPTEETTLEAGELLGHNDMAPPPSASRLSTDLGAEESKTVNRSRFLLLVVLLSSALGVALGVYFYLRASEYQAFQAHFEDAAYKVLEAMGSSLDDTFGAFDALAVSMVAHAHGTNQNWPMVTVPNFGLGASKMLSLSEMKMVASLPLVTAENRLAWEAYSLQHGQAWVDENMDLMETDPNYHGPIYRDYHMNGVIHGDFDDVPYNETTRHMLPTWQNYPVVAADWSPPFNWDYLSVTYPEAMVAVLERGTATVSEAYLLPDPADEVAVAETELWVEWLAGFCQPDEDPSEPVSDIYFPYFDTTEHVRIDPSVFEKPVGMLTGSFYWRDLIKNILPTSTDGVVVVFTNPCNPSFTYQVDGPHTKFLGRGDLHDTEYDDMAVCSKLFNLEGFRINDSRYTGPMLDKDFCPFSMHVYPSDEMKDAFVSVHPVSFAAGTAFIFIFTSIVFLIYDRSVERRQRKVVCTATLSATTAALLEEKVRERTHKLELSKRKCEEANRRIQESAAAQLEHFAVRVLIRNQYDLTIIKSHSHTSFFSYSPQAMSHEIRTRTCTCRITLWCISNNEHAVFLMLPSFRFIRSLELHHWAQ